MRFTRRDFLRVSGASAAALSLGGCFEGLNLQSKTSGKKPNILWISTEDISSHLGCYGDENAITPNIDRLAEEGVRYTQAFTVHGVCAPNRTGIIMGMYPSSLGACDMRCRASRPEAMKGFQGYLREAGYYCTNNSKTDYNFSNPPMDGWNESSRKAHWKNGPEGKPFFAVFNFTGTHESRLWSSAKFDKSHPGRLKKSEWQKPENMTVPPIYPDTPAVRRDLARLNECITELDYFVKDKLDEVKQAGLYDETIVFIWSDHGDGLPRAKRWLYDSGTLVPIIVRVPEQFRINRQGQANTADDQLVNSIDLGPTTLNLAGVKIPKHMHGQAFLGRRLPAKRKYIFGARDRIDEIFDMVRSVRDERYRYVRNFMPFVPYLPYLSYAEKCNTMKEMRRLYAKGELNDVQAQWMADRRPAEELYDLENDPWETKNLAGDAKYAGIKKHLAKVLSDWMIETRDAGLIPEAARRALAKELGSEYAILNSKGGKERTKKLLQLAIIASEPDAADREILYKALASDDAAARYWAVTATSQLSPRSDAEKLRAAADDDDLSVSVAAAKGLGLAGYTKEAAEVLEKKLMDFDGPEIELHFALDALDRIGDDAKIAIGTVKKLNKARPKTKYINRIAKRLIDKFK